MIIMCGEIGCVNNITSHAGLLNVYEVNLKIHLSVLLFVLLDRSF